MPAPTISGLPEAPSISDPANFDAEADAFVAALATLRTEVNAFAAYVDALLAGASSVGNATTLLGKTWAEKVFAQDILINGDGMINQRVPGAGIADDTYDFDRWYTLTQTGTIAVSQVADVANGTPFMMRMTQSQAVAQRIGRAQIIEGKDCRHLRGQTVTLSVKARISNSQPLRYAILEWTGTEDSPTSDIVLSWTSGVFTAGNFFLAANLTVSGVGSATPAGATLETLAPLTVTLGSTFNNLIVMVWTEGTAAQNVTLDIAARLGRGSELPEFSRRSYAEELALCQRYFWKTFDTGTAPATAVGLTSVSPICYRCSVASSVTQGMYASFPVTMRSAPTITFYNPLSSNAKWLNITDTADSGDASILRVGPRGFFADNPQIATDDNGDLIAVHATAVAEL